MKSFSNFPLFLIESIPNPVVAFNSKGDILYANEKGDRFIKEFFKDNPAELKEIFSSIYEDESNKYFEKIKDAVEFRIIPLPGEIKVLFIERKKSLLTASDLIEFFSEISVFTDINMVLQKVTDFLLQKLSAKKVTIFLYNEKEKVYKRITLGVAPPFKKESFKKNVFNVGEGITGKVIETGVTFYAPDVERIKEYYRSSPFEKSEIVVPIKDNYMVYGTIGVGSDKKDAFRNEDIKMIERVSKWLLFIIKNLYVYQDVVKERKAIEIIHRIPQIFKGEDIKSEYCEFLHMITREYGFSGAGIRYGDIELWEGEGGEEFKEFLRRSDERVLEGVLSGENFKFYVLPLEKSGGYFVFSSREVYSDEELERLQSHINFLEEFLLRETRKGVSSIHRRMWGTLLEGVQKEEDVSKLYYKICEFLNELFNGEITLLIDEKGKRQDVISYFPEDKEIDLSLISLPVKEEISEDRMLMVFEKKEGALILYISHPKKFYPLNFLKDFLKDYFVMLHKVEEFQRNMYLLVTLRKLLESQVKIFSLKEYLDEICRIIKENLGYAFVGILLREANYLKLISGTGYEQYKGVSLKLKIGEEGLSGIACKRGETIYSPDVSKDPFYVKVSDAIKSEVAIPLKTESDILGVLVVSSSKVDAFSEEEINFLETLGDHISLFIHDRLEKEEKEEIISFLEEESKFNEMILRNLPIGIVVADTDLKIKRVNEGFALLLKKSVKDLIGVKICHILCSHEEGGFCKIEDSLINRKLLFKEKFIVNIEGESVPMAVTSSFIYTSENTISGVILMVEDIREVAKLEEQLRRTERLSAIGKIAAYMAHEIKNPLASISTGIEFVTDKLPPENNIRSYMDMILKEIYRLDRLIKNLLSFASRKPLNKIPVNIFDILNECVTLLTPEIIGKDIKLKTEFESNELIVHLDPDQFKEVVLNLVRNAIDAIEKEGEVEIGCKRVGNNVVFWCKDNGKGIREEYLHNIFEPFFSTKKGGSGLGLAIVHKIIEDHGGKIEVESEYGKGSIFRVFLPL